MPGGQSIAKVRELPSTIKQAIPNRLINGNLARRCFKADGPWCGFKRFRRIVQAKRNAEFALFAVNMLREVGALQIGGDVNIRWFDRLSRDRAHRSGELIMKVPGDALVVSYVTARILQIAEAKASGQNALTKIAS